MSVRTLVLDMPETLYSHLENQAKASKHSLNDLVLNNLTRTLPPIEDDLPQTLREEFEAMERLSDHALWQIAESKMSEDEVALYDVLLERNRQGTLMAEGRQWLNRLRESADELMLRKAQAYALLYHRGHELPTLEELRKRKS